MIQEVEYARGIVVEDTYSDYLVQKLVNEDFIISDAQFANAKAWILNGDRTYMGRSSTKLLLSDFLPTLKQLSTLESDSVRVMTKEELVLMLKDKYQEGFREGVRFPYQKTNPESEGNHILTEENLRLSLELLQVKEELKNSNKEVENLQRRIRDPRGMEMLRMQAQGGQL